MRGFNAVILLLLMMMMKGWTGSRLADYAAVLRVVATGKVMPYLCTLREEAFEVNDPFQSLRQIKRRLENTGLL